MAAFLRRCGGMRNLESRSVQNVICMKWGTAYGADYVNKLYSMVSRNTSRPLRFSTDDDAGLYLKFHSRPLPIWLSRSQLSGANDAPPAGRNKSGCTKGRGSVRCGSDRA